MKEKGYKLGGFIETICYKTMMEDREWLCRYSIPETFILCFRELLFVKVGGFYFLLGSISSLFSLYLQDIPIKAVRVIATFSRQTF